MLWVPRRQPLPPGLSCCLIRQGRRGLNLTLSFFTRRCAVSPKEAAITASALMLFDKAGKTMIKSYLIILDKEMCCESQGSGHYCQGSHARQGRRGLNLTLSFFTRRCAVSPKEVAITLMLFDKAGKTRIRSYLIILHKEMWCESRGSGHYRQSSLAVWQGGKDED